MSEHQSVTRYVATYVNKDGQRTLMAAAQGRNTYETMEMALAWLDAVIANNSVSTVESIWGDDPRFKVCACPCWPGHFDPKTVWFDP